MKIGSAEGATLIVAISEAIQGAHIHHYGYVSFPERWEEEFRSNIDDEFQGRLYKSLDEGGLESFLQRYFREKIAEYSVELPPPPDDSDYKKSIKKLSLYPYFSDSLTISRNVVAELAKIPHQYEVYALAFPSAKESFPRPFNLKISDQLSLVSADLIPGGYKFRHEDELINNFCRVFDSSGEKYEKFYEKSLYFRYRTSGLVTDRLRPKPLHKMYDDIRAFYGAAMCFDIVQYYSFFKEDVAYPIFVNKLTNDEYELTLVEKADADLHDAGQAYAGKKLRDAENNTGAVADLFSPVIKIFNSSESQRLRTSAIWLLRSFLSEKGMDRILDSTIAIEVLLGDREASDRVGLSKLMANRCAYSLGQTAHERRELFEFFTKFYRVRSEIVHSGRLYVSDDEKDVVNKGLKLAARILRHEVEMN